MTFADLALAEPILRAVTAEGYTVPTPIQAQAIPHVMAGSDVLGCAQTGTGKTAAFALPILHRLFEAGKPARIHGRPPRVLVLSPTRELAAQIGESFRTYGSFTKIRGTVIFGGVGQGPQVDALRQGIDVLVATPGRLLDLFNQRRVDLSEVTTLVLDEADHMLDMGFIPDVRRIIALLPAKRQNLLFSATMPAEIRHLADEILRNPVSVKVAAASSAAETVTQSLYRVEKRHKPTLLKHVLSTESMERVLVFTRTKHGADRVTRQLERSGIAAVAIHGDKTQAFRQRALRDFKSFKVNVLVATDVAARGLDIDNVSHVINYDIPHVPETYVHRIGRTGRAGASGIAISFCDSEERGFLKSIQRLIGRNIDVREDHPEYPAIVPREPWIPDAPKGHRAPREHSGRGHGGHTGRAGHGGHSSHAGHGGHGGHGGHASHADHGVHAGPSASGSRHANHSKPSHPLSPKPPKKGPNAGPGPGPGGKGKPFKSGKPMSKSANKPQLGKAGSGARRPQRPQA
jgi:ATP-dependent RNA helicase RhlE